MSSNINKTSYPFSSHSDIIRNPRQHTSSSTSSSNSTENSNVNQRIERLQKLLKIYHLSTEDILEGLEIQLIKVLARKELEKTNSQPTHYENTTYTTQSHQSHSPSQTSVHSKVSSSSTFPPSFQKNQSKLIRTASSPMLTPDPGISDKTRANMERARQFSQEQEKNNKQIDLKAIKKQGKHIPIEFENTL